MTGRRAGARGLLAIALIAGGACGGSSKSPTSPGGIEVPSRAATAGDKVLRHLPAGADLLVEVDLARVRGNPVVGEAVTRWLRVVEAGAAPPAAGDDEEAVGDDEAPTPASAVADLGRAPLLSADVIVLAAYGVGTDSAATATLIVGSGEVPGAVALATGVAILAPPILTRRAEAATAGAEPSLAGDRELLALRAGAMPDKATGATVRVAGRLGFDARVALASATGAQVAPRALSVWADVADDAALIAVIDGADGKDGGVRLASALERIREQILSAAPVRAAGLSPSLRRATIARSGDRVRVVAVVGPRRLRRAAGRLAAAAPVDATETAPPPAAPDAATPNAKESSP